MIRPARPTDPAKPASARSASRSALQWVLRFDGIVLCCAVFAILLSDARMNEMHEGMGMGPLPEGELVSYLTRTVSGLYFLRGVLVLLCSTDVLRYLPVVRLLGWGNLAFGVFVLILDLRLGMPAFWTWMEGPSVIGIGLVMLVLAGAVAREPSEPASSTVLSR